MELLIRLAAVGLGLGFLYFIYLGIQSPSLCLLFPRIC